ncbi:MAG: hypothetical protein E7056_09790 [Lentisphaerae bacterium]|nr:hypothetical protein [Lentisphaerota bacterium]
MKISKIFFLLMLSAAAAPCIQAAHIGFLMPAGGKRGTTLDVVAGGQGFGGINSAWISGKGVTIKKVEVIPGFPYIGGKQRQYIYKMLQNYHSKKAPLPPPSEEELKDWRKHPYYSSLFNLTDVQREQLYQFLLLPKNALQASPAIASRTIVTLEIAPDAPKGVRELRLIARNGSLSNPLKFIVSDVPEYREIFMPFPPAVKTAVKITIPSAVNGQILPGETDSFTFDAVKGEQLNFKLRGRYFNAFIGDGVPGHFQAVLEVTGKNGQVVAYADDHFFDPDPALSFTVPENGTYTLKVRDALYRGREDFIYRIDTFKGKMPLPDAPAPEIADLKVEDLDDLQIQKPLQWPVMLRQTLQTAAGNSCNIRLAKDEEVVLEVFARRLALPPDTVIKVFDSKGKMLAFNDDCPRLKAGTVLHNAADSMLIFKAPADGIYSVNVSDIAQACGEAYKYYLRIDRPRTRFAVYAVPSSLLLTGGTANRITLVAERFDKFDGDITIKVKSPAGIKLTGSTVIPAGSDRTTLTLTAPFDKNRPIRLLELTASAGDFTTRVIPGNEAMQAFAYTHINPAESLPVRVMYQNRVWQWKNSPQKIELNANKTVNLTAFLQYGGYSAGREFKLVAENPPKWLKVSYGKKSVGKSVLVKDQKKRRNYVKAPQLELQLSLDKQAIEDQAQSAMTESEVVLFKVVWDEFSKPDKNGKVRRYPQELLLPALHIIRR